MKKGYFSQLSSSGRIPTHAKTGSTKKFFKYEEVVVALEGMKDPTRDPQREANAKTRDDDMLFSEKNIPEKSVATMSDNEKKKYDKDIADKLAELEDISSPEENVTRPQDDSSAAEWNVFKIKQQGLNYEIDRKVKERRLMPVSEFKAAAEILLSPLNQGLEDLGFMFKSKFPDVSDDKIQWLLDRTNQLKVDVQNVSI